MKPAFCLFVMVGLLAFLAPACARERVFGLVPPASTETMSAQGCARAAKDMAVSCVLPEKAGEGPAWQQAAMAAFVARKVDGIAIFPVASAPLGAALEAARAAGIPVVAYGADLGAAQKDDRMSVVGPSDYDIGRAMAQAIRRARPAGGTICLQIESADGAGTDDRVRVLRETLADLQGSSGKGLRLEGRNNWYEPEGCPVLLGDDKAGAAAQMAQALAAHPDLDVFVSVGGWAQWAPGAYRAALAGGKAGLGKRPFIVAAGAAPGQLDLLGQGLSDANVSLRAFDMGYKAAGALLAVSDGQIVPVQIDTGLDVCTPATRASCAGGSSLALEAREASSIPPAPGTPSSDLR